MTETPNERTEVELTLIEQLRGLGWRHLQGDTEVPYLTERASFREVLLPNRLRDAVRRINPYEDGKPWLDDARLGQAVGALERLGAYRLIEANQAAHDLLLAGTPIDGDPERDAGRDRIVRFIDLAADARRRDAPTCSPAGPPPQLHALQAGRRPHGQGRCPLPAVPGRPVRHPEAEHGPDTSPGRSLGITVDRGAQLIVHAPVQCPGETIQAFVRRKRFWVYSKLAVKGLLFRGSTIREFVTGETFFYLGRSYRLKLLDGREADSTPKTLRLFGGFFLLPRSQRPRAEAHFRSWYSRQAEGWVPARVERLARRLGVVPQSVSVRDLGHRWGSCGPSGRVYVHWSTLQLPPRIVEYILAHEILHLSEPRHSVEFWLRLARAMPDLAERRCWLAENGADYAPWKTAYRAAS